MFDPAKLDELRELARIPNNCGEQFINVELNIQSMHHGYIKFGFNWKSEMGEYDFDNLDDAIAILKRLRKRAKL